MGRKTRGSRGRFLKRFHYHSRKGGGLSLLKKLPTAKLGRGRVHKVFVLPLKVVSFSKEKKKANLSGKRNVQGPLQKVESRKDFQKKRKAYVSGEGGRKCRQGKKSERLPFEGICHGKKKKPGPRKKAEKRRGLGPSPTLENMSERELPAEKEKNLLTHLTGDWVCFKEGTITNAENDTKNGEQGSGGKEKKKKRGVQRWWDKKKGPGE